LFKLFVTLMCHRLKDLGFRQGVSSSSFN